VDPIRLPPFVSPICLELFCIFIVIFLKKKQWELDQWASEITSNAPPDIVKLLVGTKSDLTTYRVVSKESGQGTLPLILLCRTSGVDMLAVSCADLAKQMNALFIEASALDGTNVAEAFETIAKQILEHKSRLPLRSFAEFRIRSFAHSLIRLLYVVPRPSPISRIT
jgi:GTPase SAR1 family protein